MARYIDAEALLSGYDVRKVTEYDESGCGIDYKAVPVEAIEAAPTVDAEPVEHSMWLEHLGSQHTRYWTCLNCDTLGSPRWKRCPVCEAKMDGGAKNAAD